MNSPPDPQLGSARAWLIWSLSALAFGYAFFQRVAPGVMVSELMADFAIGAAVLGTLSALYFYPYVLLQIPLGALLDRLGPRVLLTVALSIAGAGSVLFATAESLAAAYAGRLLIGIGSAVGFLGSLALAANWFPPHRYAFLAGLVMFFGMMSGVLAQAPLAGIVDQYGWRTSVWFLGIAGFILALAIFIFVRNAPLEGSAGTKATQSWKDIFRGLGRAAASLEVWKVALVASTMSGPMLTIGGLWGTPYLISAYGLDKSTAAASVSVIFFAWAIGAPLAGWLSDRIRMRKRLLVAGATAMCLFLAMVCLVPDLPLAVTVILFALIGLFGAFMAICFALVREVSPPQVSGSVTGIVNSMTVASGAILQPAVGLVLDLVRQSPATGEAARYQATDFQTGFLLILLSGLAGLVATLFLKETPIWDRSRSGDSRHAGIDVKGRTE